MYKLSVQEIEILYSKIEISCLNNRNLEIKILNLKSCGQKLQNFAPKEFGIKNTNLLLKKLQFCTC